MGTRHFFRVNALLKNRTFTDFKTVGENYKIIFKLKSVRNLTKSMKNHPNTVDLIEKKKGWTKKYKI